ncbi:Cytoplasmic phosphatidylinositol transfer protein 1 [Aptenodytes forsteri]|uniref:Cytoplasmic phosphatidylinositol transfer protein 1 n=1 Tax=Aptenodytes forsteri TaxID=9233 RepID=A0A087QIA8_APTFO|nr:Cytoplasmic phosphatidylinositol transfer protein 1 [Aptenodytes forsteri]
MLIKEYRICMPLTTEEYRVGQLYTISKHSHQESEKGEGVEVVKNEPHEDPVHGPGQFTEKRVHLSRVQGRGVAGGGPGPFPSTWRGWGGGTGVADGRSPQCSFLPKFSIYIETKYEDNCGDSENIFRSDKILGDHEVSFLDIAFDEIPERYYRSLEGADPCGASQVIRDILLIGHRQAFAWVDEWCDMSLEEVRAFETQMQVATNQKLGSQHP